MASVLDVSVYTGLYNYCGEVGGEKHHAIWVTTKKGQADHLIDNGGGTSEGTQVKT